MHKGSRSNRGSEFDLVKIYYAKIFFEKELPIKQEFLLPTLEDSIYLYRLLYIAQENDRLHEIPEKFKNQIEIAKAVLIHELNYDWIELTALEFIQEEEIKYKGEKVRVYFYKFKYQDDYTNKNAKENWHLAVTGPQPMNRKKWNLNRSLVNYSYEPFDPYLKDKAMADLLQEAIENAERGEEEN